MQQLSEKTKKYIDLQDEKANKISGWEENEITRLVSHLINFGQVEIGWLESCGTTHVTHKIYRVWIKVLEKLRKDGIKISEERVKHKNSYATLSGGFWQSIIYKIEAK